MDKCEICVHGKVCRLRPPASYPAEIIKQIQNNCKIFKPFLNEVCENCANCGKENYLYFDTEKDGYEAFCAYCGEKMMLCTMCPAFDSCDWHADEDGNGHCKMMI